LIIFHFQSLSRHENKKNALDASSKKEVVYSCKKGIASL